MKIGTAVPAADDLARVPHHFIQHRSITEPYTAGDFQREAMALLSELFKKHTLVILVGGSGLFLDAVTKGLDIFPEVPPGIREELNQAYREKGIEVLQELLARHDPEYFQVVDRNNPQRLVRALEVCLGSGKPYSSFKGKRKAPAEFRHIPLGITAPREVVYERIDQRVDQMMELGLLEEAEALYPQRNLSALQTVGYQELFAYMDGREDLKSAVEQIKKNTRRFAKRQGTWFRKDTSIHWIPYNAETEVAIRYIDGKLENITDESN